VAELENLVLLLAAEPPTATPIIYISIGITIVSS
jgi:hypothetical protein